MSAFSHSNKHYLKDFLINTLQITSLTIFPFPCISMSASLSLLERNFSEEV